MTKGQFVGAAGFVLLLAPPAQAANYSVKAGGGGDFATVQACADVAQAGDVCEVYAGTYDETVTVPRSGSAGSPITFRSRAGEAVIVKAFVITNRSHITISGFEINNSSGRGIYGAASHHAIIEDNYIHSSGGQCIRFDSPAVSSDVIIRRNRISYCGWGNGGSGATGIDGNGDRMLIEDNDISHTADCMWVGGANLVIRNNRLHDVSHDELPGSSEHLDGFQVSGTTLNYSLIEGNVFQNCSDSTRNCHFLIVRDQTAAAADTIIFRFNYAQKIDGSGVTFGGVGDDVPNAHYYNNTCALESSAAENQLCVSFQNAPYGVVKNNISFNSQAGGWYPWGGSERNGNLAYVSGYHGAWPSPYSTEATYATLSNRDPLFANYPSNGTLQASSPARQSGVALTNVAASDSGAGTTLVVSDSRVLSARMGWRERRLDPGGRVRDGSDCVDRLLLQHPSTRVVDQQIGRRPGASLQGFARFRSALRTKAGRRGLSLPEPGPAWSPQDHPLTACAEADCIAGPRADDWASNDARTPGRWLVRLLASVAGPFLNRGSNLWTC